MFDTLLLSIKLDNKLSQPSHYPPSDRLGYATLTRPSGPEHFMNRSQLERDNDWKGRRSSRERGHYCVLDFCRSSVLVAADGIHTGRRRHDTDKLAKATRAALLRYRIFRRRCHQLSSCASRNASIDERLKARQIISVRFETFNLVMILLICTLTVLSLIRSSCAMILLASPSVNRSSTAISRGVSS
jgi:hypothetical protein